MLGGEPRLDGASASEPLVFIARPSSFWRNPGGGAGRRGELTASGCRQLRGGQIWGGAEPSRAERPLPGSSAPLRSGAGAGGGGGGTL